MTPPVIPIQGEPFDVDNFIRQQDAEPFDVDAFVADSTPFDVDAFVAEKSGDRSRPTATEAAEALAATSRLRGPLPTELLAFGRSPLPAPTTGVLAREARRPPRAIAAAAAGSDVTRSLGRAPELETARPPGVLQPDQPSDGAELLAGALERHAAHRTALVSLAGGNRLAENLVTAGEELTSLAQLPFRAMAGAIGVREQVEDRIGISPARSRGEIERAGLRFQPNVAASIDAAGDPIGGLPERRELPGVVRTALSPLGIATESDLAGFIGSLPLLGPVFKPAGLAARAVARRVAPTVTRAAGTTVGLGGPKIVARIPGAVSASIEMGGTVGGGGGLLAAGEALAEEAPISEVIGAGLMPVIHQALSLMDPSHPSLTALAAIGGLARRPAFRAQFTPEQVRADLEFRTDLFREMEFQSAAELTKTQLEGEVRTIEETLSRHSEVLPADVVTAMQGRAALDRAMANPSPDALTKFDTPEVLEARQRASELPQTVEITTPEREVLRDGWLDRVYGNGAGRQERQAVVVLGLSASGKSSATVKADVRRFSALEIDADVFKELMPEFEGGRGSGVTHLESAELAGQLLRRAMENGDNIVYPRVASRIGSLGKEIDLLRENGYTVHLRFVELPIEKAAQRAVMRFYQEGRFVDPNYIVNTVGGKSRQSYEALKNDPRIETFREVNNDVRRGESPVLVEEGSNRRAATVDAAGRVRGEGGARSVGDGGGGSAPSGASLQFERRADALRDLAETDPKAANRDAGFALEDLNEAIRRGTIKRSEAIRLEQEIRQFDVDVPAQEAAAMLVRAKVPGGVQTSILEGLEDLGRRVTRDLIDQAKGDAMVFTRLAQEAIGRDTSLRPGLLMNERGSMQLRPDDLQANPNMAELPPHSRRIQEQIRVGLNDTSLPTMNDIYTALIRKTAGLEQVERQITGGSEVPASASPGAAARLASGSARRSEGFLEIGPAQWTPDGNLRFTGTPSYKEVLSPVGDINALRRYELAALTVDLARERTLPGGQKRPPVETGITLEDARLEVQGAGGVTIRAAEQSVTFRREGLEYLGEAGGVSPMLLEMAREMSERYVPLNRVFEGKDPLGRGTGSVGQVGQQIKRRRGSKRPIIDPVESTVDQNRRFIRAGDTNRVALRLIELAEAAPDLAAGLIERVAEPKGRPLSIEAKRLREAAERRGIEMTEEMAEGLTGIFSDKKLDIADGIINVWRDGRQQQWRVAPEVARAIQALRPGDVPMWVRMLGMPAQLMKGGITLNPGFQAFNFIRDTFDATLQSQWGFKLGIDSFKGFHEAARAQWLGKPSQVYKEFVLGGGGFSTQRGQGGRRAQSVVRRILPQSRGRSISGRILHPIEAMKEFGAPFEEAARVGEFMLARKQGASVMEAVLASQEVTVNFQQVGAQMQGLAYMTAFLNPALQSLDRFARVGALPFTKRAAAKKAGAGAVEQAGVFGGEAARLMATAVGTISFPSMMFWLAARDDQEINDLRKTNAGLIYWFVREPKSGEVIRIPKPFLYGQIFGTGMEAALDLALEQDPEGINRWIEGMLDQIQANVIPTAGMIVLQQVFNKNLFFNSPIVPRGLENVEPRFQFRAQTGVVARKIGDLLNISPARIEQLNRDLFGTLGGEALRAADAAATRLQTGDVSPPTRVSADRALIGRFFARAPSLNVQPIRKFYDDALKAEEAENSLRVNRDNITRFQDVLNRRQIDLALAPTYAGARAQLSAMRNSIETLRNLPDRVLSPQRKQESIAEVMRQMIEVARATNTIADLFREELEAQQEARR